MERLEDKNRLDEALTEAIGSEGKKPDFEKWKQQHPEAVEMLTSRAPLETSPSGEVEDARSSFLTGRAGRQESARSRPPNIGRIIMKSRITKIAAAAVIIIAISFGIKLIGGPDMANIAWGNVISRVAQADYVHCYYFKSRSNDFIRHFEAWYAHGKLVLRGDKGDMSYDDGQMEQGFDEHGRRITKGPSRFAEGQTFFEVFTAGLLSDKNGQFSQQTPTNVGDDFLIYKFDPLRRDRDFGESIFITVGKNSLLPVQLKFYHKDGDYDLIMFDYEASEKPPEFFEPPTVGSANCGGEVVLDGEEVVFNIEGAPGLKQAIVRLHNKSYDSDDVPTFSLEVVFIVEEGFTSMVYPPNFIRVKLNEAMQCGVGPPTGDSFDDWPDGQYRNIRFSPLVKSTDREDTYIVEISCWIKTKDD